MIVQNLIDEIEGIMILLTRKDVVEVTTALNALPVNEIEAYRDSIALEYEVLTKKKVLTT
jgi:hypothetical protein